MDGYKTVSELAYRYRVFPRHVDKCIKFLEIETRKIATVRLVAEEHWPVIEAELQRRGWLPEQAPSQASQLATA